MASLVVHGAAAVQDTLLQQQSHTHAPVYCVQQGVSEVRAHELVDVQVNRILGGADPLYQVVEGSIGADGC